ncbi:MAG: glutamine--fructose-6-phosphate transaminase (isomerizing) [Rikenellaceae bacterium]|mgnify:FL=1|jgi:glucosamine--fructose-6-phosphate aminotransferase (isomerizing)|nr:glutamine--fructose-6-phosphate transaminase (isomerizing) [Tidjanibacter sp.]MBS1322840.1 glutamine--fructose-6-phosphate transaminase (isomerizing) [Rikenellaceae bacterium]
MCGIVGYVGSKDAYPILIKGLHRLEYRGYDSAGIALINPAGKLNVYKSKGKVAELEHFVEDKDTSGTIGIAHTRWATHGEPNDVNAHPHYSENGSIALIHNGIIENYGVLKAMLAEKGYTFRSETDTEVLVQFIEYLHTENRCTLFEAVQAALNQVIGAYAIAVLDRTNNDEIIAARKSSPLVVGIGEGEYFLASDATPIVEYVKDVVYLNDGEIAVINRHKPLKVVNLNNIESKIDIRKLEMNISELEKGGYPHFMLKEIFEQPRTITDCIRGRINVEGTNVVLSGILDNKERFLNARRIIFVACGTSWHAGLIGEYLFEDLCGIEVKVEYASEFRYRNPVIHSDDVVIAISQSGETADTLAAIELAKSKGAFVYGICNVVGSSIARATHSGTYIHVGPEIGVASTKAFTGQVTVLVMMAMMLAKMKGLIDEEKYREVLRGLIAMPDNIKEVLDQHEHIQSVASIFTYARNFLYLGRGCNYPTAMEGALKLKEISYIHAEGCPAAEMKHGTIALIDQEMPTIVIATNGSVYEKTISNIQEIKARGGKVIVVVTEGDCIVAEMADYCIWIPKTAECLTPLLSSIPLQLFAYYIAVNKGRNVDQPRNLAKSVTVE